MRGIPRIAATLLLGLWIGPLLAASVAEQAVERGNAIVGEVIEAYGGAEAISGLTTLQQSWAADNRAVGQSRRPEPPYDSNQNRTTQAVDFENSAFVTENQGSGGGFDFHNRNIINGEDSFQVDFRANTAIPVLEPDFATTSGPFIRVTPALLVKQLQERRQTAMWLGETTIDDQPHDAVTLVMSVGPALVLYVHQDSHLITRSERVLPGFGTVQYRFTEYEPVAGIPFNQRFQLYLNGDLNTDWRISRTLVNEPLGDMVQVPAGIDRLEPQGPDEFSTQRLADGVYLIGGSGTYALFVEMADEVVAVGGTAGIPDRIAALREHIPDKPINFGVLTHHHSDHILGVSAYEAEGATVVTVADNETVVRDAAADGDSLKLEFVDGMRVFESGGQRLEIHDVGPTPHVEHMLVAWLPEHGILFEADHFGIPRTGPVPPAVANTLALAEAIERKGFDVRQMVGAHSPAVGDAEDLAEALAKAESD